jgi:hypothetical protein
MAFAHYRIKIVLIFVYNFKLYKRISTLGASHALPIV